METEQIRYRLRAPRASESELGFIIKSWLRSLADSRTQMDKASGYYEAQKRVIASLLESSRVVIACGAGDGRIEPDADHIYGFGVGSNASDDFRGAVLHWVYVKHECRKMGIGAAIARELGADPEELTTITACTSGWIRARARHYGWHISEFAPLYAAINHEARKAG